MELRQKKGTNIAQLTRETWAVIARWHSLVWREVCFCSCEPTGCILVFWFLPSSCSVVSCCIYHVHSIDRWALVPEHESVCNLGISEQIPFVCFSFEDNSMHRCWLSSRRQPSHPSSSSSSLFSFSSSRPWRWGELAQTFNWNLFFLYFSLYITIITSCQLSVLVKFANILGLCMLKMVIRICFRIKGNSLRIWSISLYM